VDKVGRLGLRLGLGLGHGMECDLWPQQCVKMARRQLDLYPLSPLLLAANVFQ